VLGAVILFFIWLWVKDYPLHKKSEMLENKTHYQCPLKKRKNSAAASVLAEENKNVPITQILSETKIINRVDIRSKSIPAGIIKITFALKYAADSLPTCSAVNEKECIN